MNILKKLAEKVDGRIGKGGLVCGVFTDTETFIEALVEHFEEKPQDFQAFCEKVMEKQTEADFNMETM